MKNCLYCNSEFEEKNKKKEYCSDLCRSYSNRAKNRSKTEQWKYIEDSSGKKFPLDKPLVLKLAIFYGLDVRVPKKDKIAKNEPKIDIEIKPKVSDEKMPKAIVPTIVKQKIDIQDTSFELPQKIKVDYRKEYELCEFPDEYKALWDKINADDEVCTKDKKIWKITLNIK